MIINKRCLASFSNKHPIVALGTKSKLFDPTFSSTSEIFLYDYSSDTHSAPLTPDSRFNRLRWCETNTKSLLAGGLENGCINIYALESIKEESQFMLKEVYTNNTFLSGDVLGLDFNSNKNMLAAGSFNGKLVLWNVEQLDKPYSAGINTDLGSISALSWNPKVAHIICAGTTDGSVIVLDLRQKKEVVRIRNNEITSITQLEWHPTSNTALLIGSESVGQVFSYDLNNDTFIKLGECKEGDKSGITSFSVFDSNRLICSTKNSINIVDLKTNELISSASVEGIFDAQLCRQNPDLISISKLSGKTEITTLSALFASNPSFSNFLPRNVVNNAPFALCGRLVIGKNIYRIKIEELDINKVNEKDTLRKKVFDLVLKNDIESIKKDLINLLIDPNYIENSDCEGLNFDINDELTLALIKGEDCYEESLKSGLQCPVSYLVALSKGNEFVNDKIDRSLITDIRVHLIISYLTGNFDYLIKNVRLVEWNILVAFLCNTAKNVFIDCIEKLADRIKLEDGKMLDSILTCYLICNDKQNYYITRTSQIPAPKNVFDVRRYFEDYSEIVKENLMLGGDLKGPMFDEYAKFMKYLKNEREEDISNKVEDKLKISNNGCVVNNMSLHDIRRDSTVSKPLGNNPIPNSAPTKNIIPPPNPNLPPTIKPPISSTVNNKTLSSDNIKPTPMSKPITYGQSYKSNLPPRSTTSPYNVNNTVQQSTTNMIDKSPIIPGMRPSSIPKRPNSVGGSSMPQYNAIPPRPPSNIPGITSPIMNKVSSCNSNPGSPPPTTYSSISPTNLSGVPPSNNTPRRNPPNTNSSNLPGKNPPNIPGMSHSTIKPPLFNTTKNKVDPQNEIPVDASDVMDLLNTKISFLKSTATAKKGLIFKNKIQDSLKRLAIYDETNKDMLSQPLLRKIKEFIEKIDIEEINAGIKNNKIHEIRERMYENVKEIGEGIIMEWRGSGNIEVWIPGIIGLLQVVLSDSK
ncbi:Protein transport protein SEC31 [Astathelohania contejeani]|uniref:Protein transport protein SEC31 n=1 Tax=Astathelohania contejeani TaxID=164912 RepID=A0ABQ7HZQ3_9MICR|nr:Protein transport protein SEC31 [Thelohania contejeani]